MIAHPALGLHDVVYIKEGYGEKDAMFKQKLGVKGDVRIWLVHTECD